MSSVPVTLLSGFLGAGKTTLLKYVLENSGQRLGVVVNDVAAVNIDAKLVRNQTVSQVGTGLVDTVELQNGCACCSVSDELFDSISNLLSLCKAKGYTYDRIIIEASGVAEPQAVRDKFNEAAMSGLPLMDECGLDTLVTLVDSATFMRDYSSKANLAQRQDLGEGGGRRPVVDLLVEQIECADVVVLNKTDQISAANLKALSGIVASLNPLGQVVPAEFGKVPCEAVLGACGNGLLAHLNTEGQHRGAVAAAKAMTKHDEGHKHDHDHAHGEGEDCKACADGHDHGHGHSHGHGHDHKHGEGDDCKECKDGGHGHGHKHEHEHKHEHGHSHKRKTASTAEDRFGIKSFVYSQRKPFHPQRLRQLVLRWLPVATNAAVKPEDEVPDSSEPSPVRKVLRSKGFVWLSSGHSTAHYWSHAGQHFEIRDEGDWWATVPDEEWPQAVAQRKVILADFDLEGGHGDRRQEIVFIGADMDKDAICLQLDGALLTEEEMVKYTEKWCEKPDPAHPEDPMAA